MIWAPWGARNAWLNSLDRARLTKVFRGFEHARPLVKGPSKRASLARYRLAYQPDTAPLVWSVNFFAEFPFRRGPENEWVGEQTGHLMPELKGLDATFG